MYGRQSNCGVLQWYCGYNCPFLIISLIPRLSHRLEYFSFRTISWSWNSSTNYFMACALRIRSSSSSSSSSRVATQVLSSAGHMLWLGHLGLPNPLKYMDLEERADQKMFHSLFLPAVTGCFTILVSPPLHERFASVFIITHMNPMCVAQSAACVV